MRRTHTSKYFCGNKISNYGQDMGYLDYRTLASAFDAVMCNSIENLFYADINGEWQEAEQINGLIDNSEEIEELRDELEELEIYVDMHPDDDETPEYLAAAARIAEIESEIEELEAEQDEQPYVFQWFIVSSYGAELIQDYTDDPVYYLPVMDIYVWGITHFGTSWDYVLTDVKLELGEV